MSRAETEDCRLADAEKNVNCTHPHLALATLGVHPALLVHVAGLAHQVLLDDAFLDAVQANFIDVGLAGRGNGPHACAPGHPAKARPGKVPNEGINEAATELYVLKQVHV